MTWQENEKLLRSLIENAPDIITILMKRHYKFLTQKLMPSIWLCWLIAAGLLLSGCRFGMQQVYRVGLLSGADIFNTTFEGFKAEMAELGYLEDENISYDFQAAGGDPEKMREISEKFVTDEVDLIVTTTNNGVLAARAATEGTDIPVVFTIVLAPVQTGVVDDLRRPGGNITGARNPLEDFAGKRMELLLQMAPKVKRIWIPYDPQYPTVETILKRVRQDVPFLGVELIETPVSTPAQVQAELEALLRNNTPAFDAIFIMPDLTVQSPVIWETILSLAQQHHLPIIANVPQQVSQGALFSYLSDNYETGQKAAPLADEILKGANPATIPVVSSEPRLIINYKTAQSLGLTIDDSLLELATEIIR